MDLQLNNRTALVTGASRGLGRAIARGLAAEGAQLVIVARRVALLEELCDEIVAAGGKRPVPIEADLYADHAANTLAARALAELGHVDILVNAAGGSRPLTFDASRELWNEGMTLNFWRIRELSHALVPQMKTNGFGRIINLTGTSEPKIINAAFAAKAAVHVWSKGLSRDVAKHGVTINCIQPGKLRSEQIDKRWPTEESRRAFALAEIPMERFGEPEELANLAVFLASSRASYITGTVIPVDGGSSHFAF